MHEQAIHLPGVNNARELGGYAVGGKHIRKGVLLRTAGLTAAAPEALEVLKNTFRLQTVVDFRMTYESASAPDPAIPGAESLRLPVMEMEDMFVDVDPELIAKYAKPDADRMEMFALAYELGTLDDTLYAQLLTGARGKRAYRAFFRVLLDLEDGRAILFHCTDGKDRTGCAAMLTLFALGADRDTVMRDYLLTNAYNADKLSAIRQKIAPLNWPEERQNSLLFMTGAVFEVYMNNALQALEKEYGSVEGYIRQALGIGREEIDILRQKFLVS